MGLVVTILALSSVIFSSGLRRTTFSLHKSQFSRNYALSMSKREASSTDGPAPKKAKPVIITGPEITKPPFKPDGFNIHRARLLSDKYKCIKDFGEGDCVVYWMSRDQRAFDNHALVYAQALAVDKSVPLKVVFNLYNTPSLDWGTMRAYGFMMRGLHKAEAALREKNIPFHLLIGGASDNIPKFVREHNALCLVTDFSPLRHSLDSAEAVAAALDDRDATPSFVPMVQVDAHNIVPVWHASPKLEYGARTIRPKINNLLSTFLKVS